LGLIRGQKPREFATYGAELGTARRWHRYSVPGYRGNLISDIDPAATGARIEQLLSKVAKNPFARLLTSTFADATAEHDPGFALLRYWAVLEMVADRKVPRSTLALMLPDGTPIFNEKGEPETTRSKVGRVYKYVVDGGAYDQFGLVHLPRDVSIPGTVRDGVSCCYVADRSVCISLWDIVRAVYAIRNAIAHEGFFDTASALRGKTGERLAAILVMEGPISPYDYVKSQAELALWKEVE
jgi:hypothetical protein